MSERKKLRTRNSPEELKELLESLKTQESATHNLEEFRDTLKCFIEALQDKETSSLAIEGITHISRITNDEGVLNKRELDLFFETLARCVTESSMDLMPLISCRLPRNLKNIALINKFINVFPKILVNRESVRELIAIFIEESREKDSLILQILKKPGVYSEIISRIAKLIDIDKLDEDLYIKVFCESQFFRENTELRVVRGRNRFGFLKLAVDVNLDFVLNNYLKDRDKRVRILLSERIPLVDNTIFNILLNDPDEDVRYALIRRANFRSVPICALERIMDRSEKVRNEAFRIYREMVIYLREADTPDTSRIFNMKNQVTNSRDCPDLEEIYEKFVIFFRKICEGCLTALSSEYISVIEQSDLALDFLSANRNFRGMRVYLEAKPITDFDSIPTHLKSFCLEFMFKGTLSFAQVVECIENDVFEVLKFIQDPYLHFDLLLEKALTHPNLETVEKIVEYLKPVLKFRDPIFKKTNGPGSVTKDASVDDSGVFMEETGEMNNYRFSTLNEVFLNAHTKLGEMFVDQQIGNRDYPHLYFLCHRRPNCVEVVNAIRDEHISNYQKLKLLMYLNRVDVLEDFADLLLSLSCDAETQNMLVKRKSTTATLIYFLCSGCVSVSNSSFFIKAIKTCLKSTKTEKVAQIFEKYVRSVSQDAFDVFFSICWILKNCATSQPTQLLASKDEDSLILNSVIEDSTRQSVLEDDKHQISHENKLNGDVELSHKAQERSKLKLDVRDKMLQFICNTVISARQGKVIELAFDPTASGFYKLQDHHIEMIGHNQVIYE